MAIIDLSEFRDSDGFVLNYGGRPHEVNVYTFAHSLVAFTDAYREIASQVHPELAVELSLQAVGPGSFRGKVKSQLSGLKGLFSKAAELTVLPLLVAFFYDNYVDQDGLEISTTDDTVIIQRGRDKIIIPRSAYQQQKELPRPERVHQHMSRAIEAIEDDDSVESFGLVKHIDDPDPIVDLPRRDWNRIREYGLTAAAGPRDRVVEEEVELVILKAIFSRQRRKWEFVWRGVKISAYIEDPAFIAGLLGRQFSIGNGDAIKCTMEIHQSWSEDEGVWLNTGYVVKDVTEFISQGRTDDLL
ncbi:hypothetical protein [Rhodovulum sp. 12E13]|uniref:hypothetical protein n=1 Tax=Rhodovulum sp. 12E13 TaxID=2203891 RepID=UPI0011C03A1A|nr:hypothetical protein [Rhodovulum sp. 12E13]